MSDALPSGTTPPPRGSDACLLVHGGAWAIPDEACADHRDGLRAAVLHGRALLEGGAPALDVACETVAVLEAHGAFDAGCGAVLTREGTVELDAGVMDGARHTYGAVAAVRRIAHPVRVARCLLDRGEGWVRLFVGDGAERFAEAEGFALVENASLVCERERRRHTALQEAARHHPSEAFVERAGPQGTVGCVVRDREGRLAAATSTGGTPYRPSGRVGDTPLPGAGFFATPAGAASATGWGEAIAAVLLCGRAVDALDAAGDPGAVAAARLRHLGATVRDPEGDAARAGLILLGPDGRGGWAYTTPRMARGGWADGAEPWWTV